MPTVSKDYKVSAIVSAYKSERFLRGCLDDLEAQTMVERLEIVVVNSGSPEAEHAIVSEYAERYDNIVYVRTPWREGVYAAWNRGVLMASGEYLTNANTDDRHRPDALEILSTTLDKYPEAGLVYAGYLATSTENETFESNTATEKFIPLDYDRSLLLRGYCFPGPQPMWRASLHEEYGLFEPTYRSAGDLEFWLRVSQGHSFVRVPKALGLYLKSPESVEHSNPAAQAEAQHILAAYANAERIR